MKMYNRRSIRLQGYDYSQPGEYYVTICTQNHESVFGVIKNGQIKLNDYGHVVQNYCGKTEKHFKNIKFDSFIIMPNHFHVIIKINPIDNPAGARFPRPSVINVNNPVNINRIGMININFSNINTRIQTHMDLLNKFGSFYMRGRGDLTPAGDSGVGHGNRGPTLGQIVAFFKYGVSKTINEMGNTPGKKLWQRNYYEQIIRDYNEYDRITKYIKNNPVKWESDHFFSHSIKSAKQTMKEDK